MDDCIRIKIGFELIYGVLSMNRMDILILIWNLLFSFKTPYDPPNPLSYGAQYMHYRVDYH